MTVRAKPGSRVESVVLVDPAGADGVPVVEVRVRAKAVDGAANAAIRKALAAALCVRPGAVEIVRGQTSRIKHVAVDAEPGALENLATSGSAP